MSEVGVAELAERLGVPRESLYGLAKRLGGVKRGAEPRSPYVFDADLAEAAYREIRAQRGKKKSPPPPRGKASPAQLAQLRRRKEQAQHFAEQIARGSLTIRQATPAELQRFRAERDAYRARHSDGD